NIVPSATDFKIIDKFVKVKDSDSAHMAREITLNEGLFVGYTSGAAFQATNILNEENEFNDDSFVVVVFPDHGSRYLSKIYSDEWMNNQGFYDSTFYQPKKNSINYI
ncbi:MAG: cystathionine beta-synthase, partial [Flavobacteriaceae bacterium]|nr:cystathionine beta-synthase [Flavobacteriaceae bacterium]